MLRVAKVETVFEEVMKPDNDTTLEEQPRFKLRLKLHIVMLRLSNMKPTRAQPKCVGTTTIDITCDIRPLIHQLPLTFTWEPEHLYVTISCSRLRVYRIDLDQILVNSQKTKTEGQSSTAEPSDIACRLKPWVTTPIKLIFLPHSARTRTVQYIPPREEAGDALVVVGPRCGELPRPGFCVRLSNRDLGNWVDLESKAGEDARVLRPQQKMVGPYEDFDVDEDCDIIMI